MRNIIFYDNKRRAGNWAALSSGKSERCWIWNVKASVKYRHWFAVIKTPLFHFTKNNSTWSIGLCFGKRFIELAYHW